ncbi:MAG TPA: hypothetical protein VD996_03695 [Chitinophagaceae bacterium]|nr:hypothetical protein [Chitinophagaceae bacterium]
MKKKKLSDILQKIEEGPDGTLDGGFGVILSTIAAAKVLGGEETNNCLGGNCVKDCGANVAAGCGGSVNSAPGCGVKETLAAG